MESHIYGDVFLSSGDSQAKRETRSGGQSPARLHPVPAASQGLRLRLFPQPACHPWDAPGGWSPHSQRCTTARPSAPTAACSEQRPTLGSVCLTQLLVTDPLKTYQPAVIVFPRTGPGAFAMRSLCGNPRFPTNTGMIWRFCVALEACYRYLFAFSKEHLFSHIVFAPTLQKEHCSTFCLSPRANHSSLCIIWSLLFQLLFSRLILGYIITFPRLDLCSLIYSSRNIPYSIYAT